VNTTTTWAFVSTRQCRSVRKPFEKNACRSSPGNSRASNMAIRHGFGQPTDDALHWGHVGDLARISTLLGEALSLCDFPTIVRASLVKARG